MLPLPHLLAEDMTLGCLCILLNLGFFLLQKYDHTPHHVRIFYLFTEYCVIITFLSQ